MAKLPTFARLFLTYRLPGETKQCWPYFPGGTRSCFSAERHCRRHVRGYGAFDAEAKANGQGSSPDSLGFSKLLSLLAPLFLPVWERPGISHMSRILRRRKRGWEERAAC